MSHRGRWSADGMNPSGSRYPSCSGAIEARAGPFRCGGSPWLRCVFRLQLPTVRQRRKACCITTIRPRKSRVKTEPSHNIVILLLSHPQVPSQFGFNLAMGDSLRCLFATMTLWPRMSHGSPSARAPSTLISRTRRLGMWFHEPAATLSIDSKHRPCARLTELACATLDRS